MPNLTNVLEIIAPLQENFNNSNDLQVLSAIDKSAVLSTNTAWMQRFQKHFPAVYASMIENNSPAAFKWRYEFNHKYLTEIPDAFVRKLCCVVRDGDMVNIPDLRYLMLVFRRPEVFNCWNDSTADVATYLYNLYVSEYLNIPDSDQNYAMTIYRAAMCFNQPFETVQGLHIDIGDALLCTMTYDRGAILQRYIDLHNININAIRINNKSLLTLALVYQSIACCRILLELDVNPDVPDAPNEELPLHAAVMHGNSRIFELLVLYGANIHQRNRYGYSTLHSAVVVGKVDIVRFLLANGVHPDIRDGNGRVASHLAMDLNDVEVFRILMEHGADPHICDTPHRHEASLIYRAVASESNSAEYCQILINHGVNLDEQGSFGKLPLHHAIELNKVAVCRKLIELNANLNQRDIRGSLPLKIALNFGHTEIIELIVNKLCENPGWNLNSYLLTADCSALVYIMRNKNPAPLLAIMLRGNAIKVACRVDAQVEILNYLAKLCAQVDDSSKKNNPWEFLLFTLKYTLWGITDDKKIATIRAALLVVLQLQSEDALIPYMGMFKQMNNGELYKEFKSLRYRGLLPSTDIIEPKMEECIEDSGYNLSY